MRRYPIAVLFAWLLLAATAYGLLVHHLAKWL
jgi:hypothetical protein